MEKLSLEKKMIVFCFFLILIIVSIIVLFSSIIIDVNKIEIEDIEKLKKICLVFDMKKYENIFNYINLNVKIKIVIFSLFPVKVLKINSEKAKRIINYLIIQDLKDKKKNPVKHELKRQKQKKQLKKITKKINSFIKIQDVDFNLNIGLTNPGVTAIAVGFLNTFISIFLLEFFSDIFEKQSKMDTEKQLSSITKNFNYVVNPIYDGDFAFSLNSNLKLKIPIHSLF